MSDEEKLESKVDDFCDEVRARPCRCFGGPFYVARFGNLWHCLRANAIDDGSRQLKRAQASHPGLFHFLLYYLLLDLRCATNSSFVWSDAAA